MGRHWLDVVRYADTAGFANDFDRPHAWRYRDYVIRRFNQDIPFDQFVREQIAGDEMPSSDPEARLGTGFLRMGPWEHTGMAVAAETRQQWLDDVVNIVGNSFLGMEMSCFKCHDHKFDPLPTRDYYRLQAIFAATQPADLPLSFLPVEKAESLTEDFQRAKNLVDRYQTAKGEKKKRIPGVMNPLTARFRFERWAKAYEPIVAGVYSGPTRVYQSRSLRNPVPEETSEPLMRVSVLRGGSLAAPLEEVTSGVLSAVATMSQGSFRPPTFPESPDGRRLALAYWLTNSRHPLTARVIVNRVWGWHFGGRPLVGTPNNFGVKGLKPDHPELLDWLARWFIDNGWSMKKLHRLIMNSDTYQRSSRHATPDAVAKADLEGALLAAFPVRRMTAEELRDSLLRVSGELNLRAGGPPARPQMNWDAATAAVNLQTGNDLAYRPDRTPAERNRRTVYTYHMRSRRDPFLEVFDQPASERSCEGRNESLIAPQVFSLMNGDFANDRALAMAAKLHGDDSNLSRRIETAFKRIFSRLPSRLETERCMAFVRAQHRHHREHSAPKSDIRQRIAEIVPYDKQYAKDYQPDLQPEDVAPDVRALADLCLVLFNTSEFLYLP